MFETILDYAVCALVAVWSAFWAAVGMVLFMFPSYVVGTAWEALKRGWHLRFKY